MITKLVIDASVAMKWLVPEPGSDQAEALLDRDDSYFIAPELLLAEVANGLWKNVKRKKMEPGKAGDLFREFYEKGIVECLHFQEYMPRAYAITEAIDHEAVYDCIYVAVAEAHKAILVTADGKLVKKLQAKAFSIDTILISDQLAH